MAKRSQSAIEKQKKTWRLKRAEKAANGGSMEIPLSAIPERTVRRPLRSSGVTVHFKLHGKHMQLPAEDAQELYGILKVAFGKH